MSKKYDVFTTEGIKEYAELRNAAIQVAKEFPGLSASSFFEEVRGRFYPRPDEYDMRGLVLRLVNDGDLIYDSDWRIKVT